MADHNIPSNHKSKCLMIGDNLITDILFGNNCGIDTLLLLTGVTKRESYFNLSKEELENLPKPTFILNNFENFH